MIHNRDHLNFISKDEIIQLFANIQKLEYFVDKNADRQIEDIDLSEGETLLSLIDSQIPNISIQKTLENCNFNCVFYVIRCGVVQVQEYLVTQVEVMQLSSETDLLRSLLDLVDLVSSLITRVDFSIPGKDVVVVGSQLENEFEGTDFASSSYLDQATASGASYGNAPVHSNSPTHISLSSDSTRLSGIGAASVLVDTNPFSNSRPLSENISSTSTSTVVSRSMYMLRRMGDRKQTLLAVQQLLAKLAEIEATGSRAQIKEMRDASALQTLLSALSHSTDWPDVELLIAKAICVLVPVEEDVSLLLKNALEILNALFVFQLKSAEQMPGNVFTRSDSDPGGTEKLFNPSQSTTTSFLHDTASPKVSPSREVTSGSSSSTVSDQNRSLVAEALAKLIYVLCCEWKKQDVSAIAASNGIRLNTSISMNIGGSGLQSTNASVSGSDGGRTRPRSLSASLAPLVDANQTQVQVLTVIMLVCDKYKTRYIGLLPEPPSPSSRQRKVMLESMNMRTNAPSGSDLSSSYVSSTDKTTIFLADNSIDLTSLEGSIIDDTAIVVSGALCYLAEMPQCRPALVAHGVLRLLRIWIEAGGQLLLDLKQRLFEEAAVRSVEENRILDRLSDLLCNSTRAMMFILGGSLDSDLTRAPNESQFSAQNNNSTKIASGQSNKNNVAVAILNRSDSLNRQKNGSIQFVGYEYMVGRIDADLLSEDIPSVLVRFVATIASVLSYDEINKTIRGETTSGSSRFGSVLAKMKHLAFSKQIVLHLAQSLFQLSSRGQNRPHLLAIDAPHAIFSLLWDAVVEIRAGMSGNDRAEEELERQSALFRVAANDDFMDDYSESRARSRLRSKCHLSTFPFTNSSWHDFKQELPLPSEQASTQQPLKNRTQINCDHFIRAVAQYCLDSISLFVSDSFNQVPPSLFPVPGNVSGVGVGVNVSTKTVSMLLNNNTVRNFMDESTDSKVFVVSTGNSIVDMLSNAKIMETFKYVLTTFPRGRARLSALKIISSLTDWRECIHSLHQADIIDALVVICFESEKQSASNDPVSLLFPTTAKSSASNLPSLTNQQNLQAAAAPVIVPAVKRTSGFGPLSLLRRSRDTSAPASSSMIPPRPKIERGTTISGTVSNHAAATNSLFGERPRLNRHVTDGESDVSSTSSFHSNNKAAGQATRSVLFHSNLQEFPNSGSSDTEGLFDDEFLSTANEETLTVTYALANICHARPLYAKLLLNNGLLEIMLGLYNVRNLDDVNRQVLRCISAMCPYLGKDLNQVELLAILDEPKPSITRQRNAVLMDTLVILSKALQSSSILLQREAIIGLAGLSNNPLLHKDILVGPLRHVVSIVLARDCIDQPTRSAAESILKNLGFSGGLQDIELVGYDLDVLRDWYLLRELLDPQEAALVVLRCWIADLFEGTNYSQLYNMPRSPGRAFDNAFATSAPNLYRAHSNPVVASPEKRNLIAKGFGKHSSSFSGDLNLSAGRPSFNGSLHYTSEDESTLDGSVSSPAVLDLAGNDTRKSRDEKSSPRVQARRSFEGRSDQGVSPSDVGVAASDTIGVHERTSTTDSNEGSTGNTRRKLFLPFIRKPASAERNTSDQPFSSPARGSQPTTARGSKLFKIAPSPRQFAEGLRRLVPYFLSGKSKTAASTSSQTNNPVNAVEEDDTTGSYCHDILGAFGSLTSRANSNEHDNAHSYSFFARNFSSLKSNNSSGMDETNFGLDLPPMGVLDLLDLYYPSKMHHATFMDLTSLYNEDVLVSDFSRDRALDHTASVQELMLALPTPHSVYGIGFQPRQYSFSRIRRVVERMIEEGGPAKRWSLAFQDNSFAPEGLTEFHSSLMQMLCKCPEIISLSFALSPNSSRKMPDQSGHLGHMAGSVPPNVRFINFRGVLSSESIQSLCILLRKNNFIYTFQGSDSDYPCGGRRSPSTSQHQRTALEAALLGAIPSSPGANRRTPPTSRRPSTVPDDDKCIHTSDDQSSSNPRDYHRTPLKPSKGLLGLAITHTSFTSADIKYLIELLAISPNKLNRQPKATREDGLYSTTPRGIRFLDLSYNKLGDSLCADILTASTKSPLEGLDLSGNIIHRGKDFCDILLKVLSPLNGISYLRYLGLSNNALQNTTVCQILDILQTNEQLTSLDLSCNDIQHSKRLEVSLRSCIKSNRGLRLLDLSFNKLNAVLVKHVYLGLLENECLLMMPLAGNMLAAQAPDLPLIQEELTKNRQRYREKLDAYNDNIRRSKALMFDMISLQDPRSARRNSNSNTQFGVSGPVSLSDTRSLNESQEKMYCVSESSEVDISQPIIASKVNTILQEAVHVALHSSDSPVLESRQTTPLPLAQEVSSNENFDGNSATILPVLLPVLIGSDGTNSASLVPSQPVAPTLGAIGRSFSGSININSNMIHVFFSAPLVWRDQQKSFHPLEMLDYKSERDSIVQVLSEVHRDISVSFQFATTDNLRTALSLGCRALHFSGHGHPSFLNFEDGRGGLQIVRVELLRDLLRAGGLKLDFVFVSACHSRRTGEAFIDAGVPHVVCVKVDAMIQDSAANVFTRAFYLALIGGRSVQSSFDIARQALKASPYVPDSVLEGDKFVLLPDGKSSRSNSTSDATDVTRKGDLHDRPIFQTKSIPLWNSSQHIHMGVTNGRVLATGDSSNSLNALVGTSLTRTFFDGITGCSGAFFGSGTSSLPPPPPDFEGREVDMYRVITTLLERRLVSLVGSLGCGKTSLTTSLCTYVADRTLFPDGVFYMRVTNISSHSAFLNTLLRGLFAGPKRVVERLHEIRNTSLEFQSVTASILAGMRPGRQPSLSSESLDSYSTAVETERDELLFGYSSATAPAPGYSAHETVFHQEELIVTSLSSLQVLLVLDHVDDLLRSQGEAGTDLKFFLGRLFDRCHQVKVLVNSTEPLGMRTVSGFGVVENTIALGPLTLRSSIRLYARLAPSLLTSLAKASFIAAILPPRQHNVTATSRELTRQAAEILALFGNGHPAHIVKQACESTPEDIDRLMNEGIRINGINQIPPSSLPSSIPDTDNDILFANPSSQMTPLTLSPPVDKLPNPISNS